MAPLRRPTDEDIELLFLHEEPRNVTQTATICYSGRHYRVPDPYIGRRVWTRLKGNPLTIQVGRISVADYTLEFSPAPERRRGERRAQRCVATSAAAGGQIDLAKSDILNLGVTGRPALTPIGLLW